MRKFTIPLSPLHLRKLLLLRCFSASPDSLTHHPLPAPRCPPPSPPLHRPQFLSSNAFSAGRRQWLSIRNFSSQTDDPPAAANPLKQNPENPGDHEDSVVKLFSDELQKNPDAEPLPLQKRLDLSFSHVQISPAVLLSTLNMSPDAGRMALDFLKWAKSRPGFEPTDEVYSYFVDYFGRRKDFKATHEVLVDGLGVAGVKSFESLVDRMVRAGRPSQTVALFERMEKDYGFARNMDSLKQIVSGLCHHGFASYAEKMVKGLANEFFPDEFICDALIDGWCVDGKLDEAKRLVGEMQRGGYAISTYAYNSILDCVCTLCRKKDPFRLDVESRNVLVEMERNGVPCDVETFNVLITNYCKIRKTSVALGLFHNMGRSSCYPDETTFLVLIKSLYQAARVGEGDEMIDRMKSAGYGEVLDTKAYYEFLKILCGIERIDHAMNVFAMMKEDGCKPGIKTYDLLMGKLCAHGRLDKANALYKEAESSGLAVEPKPYKVDPRFVKKKDTAVKKEKKRETLPEKMARKRRRLKQIRLSFVKKPKKMRRRSY
ncbi:pentatricopeptide repeat-containing protein PNM1, mitochondrial [Salvia miltiorrhiza]|uniref:Pentatricopeptide repeat protein n=1 Tax=Salvia miltiorrhiza TaxID=226208 RepID=A0A678WF54_SALMI|nr:pentatricopeptide repeat-containing protein PNM1, mitochondrial [Salvia miltiorrhiza]XP_057804997.1 pentatricopeptide repeat-containing protein PNM1, mitochondrial [Salvia miltiorrhiza]AYM01012.1 pentatricopeptide repeat protein [Salvia miltiorrhiza]